MICYKLMAFNSPGIAYDPGISATALLRIHLK